MKTHSWSRIAFVATALVLYSCPTPLAAASQAPDPFQSAGVLAVGHTSAIYRLATSPDGKWLASSDSYETIVWEIASGTAHLRLRGSAPCIFSHDSSRVVTTSTSDKHRALSIWDVASGRHVLDITGPSAVTPRALAFGEGSRLLYCINFNTVSCWDAETGSEVALGGELGASPSTADPMSRATVTLNGTVIARPGTRPRFGFINGGSFSAKAERGVVTGGDKKIYVLDMASNRVLRTIEGIDAPGVAMSPDGRYIATTGRGVAPVRLWRVNDGVELAGPLPAEQLSAQWKGPGLPFRAFKIEFNPTSDYLAVTDIDSTRVLIWNVDAARELVMVNARGESQYGSTALAFSRDGDSLIVPVDSFAIGFWTVPEGNLARKLGGTDSLAAPVAFSPDGSLLAFENSESRVSFLDVHSGDTYSVLGRGDGRVAGIAFSPDGRQVAAVGPSGHLRVFNVRSGDQVRENWFNGQWCWSVEYSPDGSCLAIPNAAGWVNVLPTGRKDTSTGQGFGFGETRWIRSAAFSPDGRTIVAGSAGGGLKAVSMTDKTERMLQEPGAGPWIWDVAVSPDGKTVAVGDLDGASLWDLASGRKAASFGIGNGWVTAVAFGRAGASLATGGGDGSVKIWNTQTGQVVRTLGSHATPVWGLTFSPNGKQLASADSTGTIILWNVETGVKIGSVDRGVATLSAKSLPLPSEPKLSSEAISEILTNQPECRASIIAEKSGKKQRLPGSYACKGGAARVDLNVEGESVHALFRPGQLPVRLHPEARSFEEDDGLDFLAIAVPFAFLPQFLHDKSNVAEHLGYVDIDGHRCAKIRVSEAKASSGMLLYAACDLKWLVVRIELGGGDISVGFLEGEGPDALSLGNIRMSAPASLFQIPKGYSQFNDH